MQARGRPVGRDGAQIQAGRHHHPFEGGCDASHSEGPVSGNDEPPTFDEAAFGLRTYREAPELWTGDVAELM
jgi:hypothetical protein